MQTISPNQADEARLRVIESALKASNIPIMERCELEDEALEIKKRLGKFEGGSCQNDEGCISCSG